MVFRPVVTDEQHPTTSTPSPEYTQQRGGDIQRPNGQVLTDKARGTTSQQRSHLLTTGGAHGLLQDLTEDQSPKVLTPPAATSAKPPKEPRQKPLEPSVLRIGSRFVS